MKRNKESKKYLIDAKRFFPVICFDRTNEKLHVYSELYVKYVPKVFSIHFDATYWMRIIGSHVISLSNQDCT